MYEIWTMWKSERKTYAVRAVAEKMGGIFIKMKFYIEVVYSEYKFLI